jgi:hypothetical protein
MVEDKKFMLMNTSSAEVKMMEQVRMENNCRKG